MVSLEMFALPVEGVALVTEDETQAGRHTVHRQLQNAYARLGCSSRAAAVAEAHRLQLL